MRALFAGVLASEGDVARLRTRLWVGEHGCARVGERVCLRECLHQCVSGPSAGVSLRVRVRLSVRTCMCVSVQARVLVSAYVR